MPAAHNKCLCAPACIVPVCPQAALLPPLPLQAVKAESFNPRTLFLFGTYTIGKERLFLEVARTMGKKVRGGTGGGWGRCSAVLDHAAVCRSSRQAGDHDSCIAAGLLVGLGPYWILHCMLRSHAPALH